MDFPLFAYGTLKKGSPAHTRWCSQARAPVPARCAGALFLHPDGYPVLFVEPETVLANGGSDTVADARMAQKPATRRGTRLNCLAPLQSTRAGRTAGVQGELLAFARGALPLAELDAYEGFTPGAPSLFVRVLVQVELLETREQRHAWTYVAGPLVAEVPLTRLVSDRWPEP